jgi:diguanylate cyclase (GGDEF)-like protein/PAS domain S-box-containing protein
MHNAPIGMALVSIDGHYEAVNPAMCRMMGRSAEEMLQLTFQDVTHPEGAEADADGARRLLSGEVDHIQLVKRYLRPDGSTVSALVSVTLIRDNEGRPTQYVTQAVDMSDRLHAEAELRRRVEQQSVVARLGQHALEGVETVRLLDEAVEAIAETLEVELVSVLELCEEGQGMRLAAGHGFPGGMVRGPSMPLTDLHREGLEQLRDGPLAFDDFESAHGANDILSRFGVKSSMSVLIGERSQPFGAFGVHSRSPRHFNDLDASFVQSVANVLWNAIARRASEQVIRHQALHDPLTGLPNRALFLDRLTQALARTRRHHTQLAVLLLDLDHFKLVNDSLGHHAGDELLRAVTPRLAEAVRAEDTVARLGGDEFVVLCEDVGGEGEVGRVAARISETLSRPFVLDGSEHFIRASVGAVLAEATATPEDLVRDADAAMYRAKERGRGRYELFDETMRSSAVVRLQTEADLRRALERGELELFYQPYYTLDEEHTLCGMEALVRWNHPERGLLLPGDFIPIAEDSGLIVEVGEHVLHEACRQLASWRSQIEHPGILGVSVNVSARQLMQPGLVEVVRAALTSSGLAPHLLALEITESVLVDSGEAPELMLAQLKALGVNLVLDDFGTGYSSLSHLKRFPFDVLKIDRAFIDGLGTDGEDDAIVTATMGMGSAMNLAVVAEGVETPEQIERLRALGCTVAQGYHFSEPLPVEAMGTLVFRELGPRVAAAT